MAAEFNVRFDPVELAAVERAFQKKVFLRTARKSGNTAMRDMVRQATKQIRARKRLKVRQVKKAMTVKKPRGRVSRVEDLKWKLGFDDKPIPLVAYPHRQTRKGVSVAVNTGKRSLLRHAFIARMPSGHVGIFRRKTRKSLPIREHFGSRPADAMLHKGEAEAVQKRGGESMRKTFARLLPLEMDKG